MRRGLLVLASVLTLLSVFSWSPHVNAQYSSNSYRVEETFIGTGGELEQCSTAYCAKQSAGETAVGRTSSTSYSSQAGFTTSDEEFLEVIVNGGTVDFGTLDTASTKTGTVDFSVKTYLASGY